MLELDRIDATLLLKCLEWADNEIAVEPYEHSSEEEIDVHCDLINFILTLRHELYGDA